MQISSYIHQLTVVEQCFTNSAAIQNMGVFIYSHGIDLSFTQNIPDSLSEWLTHTVQGLEYLEVNWVNVMAGDALYS